MPGHSSLPCADGVNLSALPGIHVIVGRSKKDVDGRVKPGHDGVKTLLHHPHALFRDNLEY